MSCEHRHLDGSYVLGALSPTERREFESHLADCAECSRSVRELAGLPGLLARVSPAVLENPPVVEPVPDTLLPALVRAVRRTRRRRFVLTAGVAAAVAAAALVVPLWAAGLIGPEREVAAQSPTASASTPAGLAMTPVGSAPVRAKLALASVTWGTRLDLTCRYEPASAQIPLPPVVTYELVVRTRDGRTEQVGTWAALEGRTMHLSAATAADRARIASVEVRTTAGQVVLVLDA
jgi:hypothetical protein